MPELIRLQTPDFEFSVWANDISQRAGVYHTTVANRARLTPKVNSAGNVSQLETADSVYVLRFSPKAELLDVNLDPENHADPDVLVTAVPGPEKRAELSLSAPLFFENTQYQFEWVFFGAVTHARLAHRSKSVCDAFRFAQQRGPLPARLTGTINTGNDVGWLRLPLVFELGGQTHTQHIAFEVLPTKMALHQDLPAMYRAIDAVYPLWRFSLVEKTEQDAASSKQRGHFPLMWLANFAALRERFEQGLKVICAAPHSRLQPTLAHYKAARLKGRVPHKLAQQIKQDLANGQSDKRYRVEKKQLSVNTPENRFIKMVVTHSKRQLAEFEAKLRFSNQAPEHQRFSDSFLNELHSWQQPLQKMLNQSFLKEVGKHTGLSRESLVLQQKTGYSAVYRVWQELKFYLDVFGHQSSISMKSVAEIYEIWCFLCLKNMLEQELGFTLVESNAARLELRDYFEYQLKDGLAGAFRFQREDGVAARLVHEPSFTTRGKEIRSYAVNQRPDIVLEVTLPRNSTFAEEKRFIWVFDAKYRIKTEKDRHDDSSQDITSTDYVPDDAINQMHRYRDALIRLSEQASDLPKVPNGHVIKKSRPVFGAFALYPGFFDQANMPNPYASSIDEVGIGAFALLPSQVERGYCGHQWLLEFLQAQIGKAPEYPITSMAEKFYVQEAARIPYSGMRQILYSDLTMTAALGGQRARNNSYFEKFKQGTALWYHLPQSTFLQKFKQHVAEEIRYLALASTSAVKNSTKQIDKLWPVKSVRLLPRYALTEEQTGKKSGSAELYYLFELGKPLTLQAPVTEVPHRPMKNSMKLTTLTRLEGVPSFDKVEKVYKEAMV